MDELDHASINEAKQNEMALQNHFAKNKKNMGKESSEECIECGAIIPKARQKAMKGCEYCVHCQEQIELGKL